MLDTAELLEAFRRYTEDHPEKENDEAFQHLRRLILDSVSRVGDDELKHLVVEEEVEARRLAGVLADVWRPNALPPIAEWARQNYRSVGRIKEGELWDPEATPFWLPIMEALHPRSPVQKVVVMGAARTGKSAMMCAWMFYTLIVEGENVLHVMPAETGGAQGYRKLQVAPEIKLMEKHGVTKTGGEDPSLERDGQKYRRFRDPKTGMTRGHMISIAALSEGATSSIGAYRIAQDEVDTNLASGKVAGMTAHLKASQRGDARADFTKELMVCAPKRDRGMSIIESEYDTQELRMKFYVPCPHCDHYQTLILENLQFNRQAKNPKELGEVFYKCDNCDGKIEEHHKRQMLSLGEWRDQNGVRFNPHAPENDATTIGCHMTSLYSPTEFMAWENFARLWLRHHRLQEPNRIKEFKNAYMAETVSPAINIVSEKDVEIRITDGPYKAGVVPTGFEYLTCGVDVAKRHIDYAILGSNEFRHIALVEAGTIHVKDDRNTAWWELERRILGERWMKQSGRGTLPVQAIAIDTGGTNPQDDFGYREQVLEFQDMCARRFEEMGRPERNVNYTRVFPIKGVNARADDTALVWKRPMSYQRVFGVKAETQMVGWHLNVDALKDLVYERFCTREDEGKGRPHMLLPYNLPDVTPRFIREFTSEEKRVTDTMMGWKKIAKWVLKTQGRPNHFFDCVVYAYALLYFREELGFEDFTPDTWRQVRGMAVEEEFYPEPGEMTIPGYNHDPDQRDRLDAEIRARRNAPSAPGRPQRKRVIMPPRIKMPGDN